MPAQTPTTGAKRSLRAFTARLQADVRAVPVSEQLASRPTKLNTVDLTGARLFVTSDTLHAELVNLVQLHAPTLEVSWGDEPAPRSIYAYVCLQIMLMHLKTMHTLWSLKTLLSASDLLKYKCSVRAFRNSWVAMGWKPTVWVHWVCAHSSFFMHEHRTLYAFSSIPIEHRHQKFKLDLRHAFHGWSYKNPRLSDRCLGHVLRLDALDQGLKIACLTPSADQLALLPGTKRARVL
jgi:hypothetical protein